jgi:hypothetical protein
MISTVTTSTVSTINLAGPLILIGVMVLFALLVQKEVVSVSVQRRASKLNWILNIGIIPLLIAFFLVLFSRVSPFFR